MIQILFALSLICPEPGGCEPLAAGRPTYRLAIRTAQILENRVRYGQLTQDQVDDPGLDGHVGLVDCGYIGQYVGITWPSGERTGPYLVIDCRQRNLPPPLPGELAAEFDQEVWDRYYSWPEYCRRDPIRVWLSLPPAAN